MLFQESTLIPQDYGIIQKVKIISTYNKKVCRVGNKILICRKKFQNLKDLKKKYLAVISQTTKWQRRSSGLYLRSSKNKAILFKETEQFLGTNFRGPLFSEITRNNLINLGIQVHRCI